MTKADKDWVIFQAIKYRIEHGPLAIIPSSSMGVFTINLN